MEKIQAATPVEPAGKEAPRPWVRALFSGAIFGTLGAAAIHWLGYHSVAPVERSKTTFGRNWTAAITGVASGMVAAYGTLRADTDAPRSVFPDKETPDVHVAGDSVEHANLLDSPGARSL